MHTIKPIAIFFLMRATNAVLMTLFILRSNPGEGIEQSEKSSITISRKSQK